MRRIALAALVAVSIAVPFGSLPAYAGPLSGRIVYTDAFGGTGVYKLSPDGTERQHLVDVGGDAGYVYHPKWFRDGSAVSFVVETSVRSTRLDAVDPDGSNRRVLLGRAKLPMGWKQILTYDWSPDGTQLVLCLFSKGSDRQRLYVSTPDGSSMDRIAGNACSPDWSSQDRIAAIRGTRLIELDPDGGNVVTIATGMQSADPAWSPNGRKIVFMCGGFTHADICVSNADGTMLKNLTNSDRTDWSPDWSPDGSRIVWAPATKNTKYQYGDLWRMRSDGSAKTRLTNTPGRDDYEPDWTAVG
jgi:Tol biopolymer transport system component